MNEKNLINKIYKEHIKQLKNLSTPNNKVVICFSGIPGSGKTHIAKILEKKYLGVRIRSDDIRTITIKLIKKLKLKIKDVDPIVYNYLSWFISNYNFPNKLIIWDRGIDRKYKENTSLMKKRKYKIFIIRIKISRKLSEKRIIKKLGKLDENYINSIGRWIREWNNFGKKVKSDIILKNEDTLNLKPLFSKLDKLIKK